MEHYISCALKQQATWHTWKVLEGQSYILQDDCFHFISLLFIKVAWQLFISFSKKRAKFKILLVFKHIHIYSMAFRNEFKGQGPWTFKCDTNWLTAEKIFPWSKLPETPYESDMEEDLISKFGSIFIYKDSLQSPSNFMKLITNFESNYLLLCKIVILKCCFRLQAWGPRNE